MLILRNCAGMIKMSMPFPRYPEQDPLHRGISLIAVDLACRLGSVILDNSPYISDCASALQLNPFLCPSGRFSFSFYNAAFGCRCCDGRRFPDRDFDIYQINFEEKNLVTCFAIELEESIGEDKKIMSPECREAVGFQEGTECIVECKYGSGQEIWSCGRTVNGGDLLQRTSAKLVCDTPKKFGERCGTGSICQKDLTCIEGNCWPYCESNDDLNDFSSRHAMKASGWEFTRILEEHYGSTFKGSSKSPSPGMISAKLQGNGTVTVIFGDAIGELGGKVIVMLNGKFMKTESKKGEHDKISFHFIHGDVLSLVEAGEAMIELISISFVCDELPICKASTKFCPGGVKTHLSPYGGCVFPECPPPDLGTCIGCVFVGRIWVDHQCSLDHTGCIEGGSNRACYDTTEDCDYYKMQLEQSNNCLEQTDCVSCTSHMHCGYDSTESKCKFIGESWWGNSDTIANPGECADCTDCIESGKKFTFDNTCTDNVVDAHSYQTNGDCEQWSEMKETNCDVYASCFSCLEASPYCAFDLQHDRCVLADFSSTIPQIFIDDPFYCKISGFVDMFSDADFMAFPGLYSTEIDDRKTFLKECSQYTSPHMTCEAVMPGLWSDSIVVFFEGTSQNLYQGLRHIRENGLNLPSFPSFGDSAKWPPLPAPQDDTSLELTSTSFDSCNLKSSDDYRILPDTVSKNACARHASHHPDCGSFIIVRSKQYACACIRRDIMCDFYWDHKDVNTRKCNPVHGCHARMYHFAKVSESVLSSEHLEQSQTLGRSIYASVFIIGIGFGALSIFLWKKCSLRHSSSNYLIMDDVT